MKKTIELKKVEEHDKYLLLRTKEDMIFMIYILNDNIIRFRGTFKRKFEKECSYALVKTAWNDVTDDLMRDERQRVEPLKINLKDSGEYYSFTTKNFTVLIYKKPFRFAILDANGKKIREDLPERAFVRDELGRIYHYSKMDDNELFYGFGEKSGKLNKFKRRMRMHNTDSLGWNAKKSDPLYKMIPFYINFNSQSRVAYGIYYNNASDSVFDIDSEHSNYWKRYCYFQADAGDIDVFFIGGPTIPDVVKHYTDLTGKTAMMPISSLGYMGSTMFYSELDNDADKAILNFVNTCKKYNIPCDGFFLSSGYTANESNGKRYVFNWNKKRFKKPQNFVRNLTDKGVLVAPNIKPGLLIDHPLTDEFVANDGFVKNKQNSGFEVDRYWGGDAHFVDFTNPNGRKIWEENLYKSLLSLGIFSIWNDNNEYEIEDNEAKVYAEGIQKKIGEIKPILPTMMAKTAHLAMKEYYPNIRPYVVNRAGFSGIQRYAQTWAGDNRTSWTNLKYNIPTILGMGLSGVANQGCDIGGFDGPAPEPELLVRWVQNGIFQPRFSIHSANDDNTVTEPWMYPDYTEYIASAIRLRYKLIPYFYSLLWEAHQNGTPIMRPLVYEFPNDPQTFEESFEFLLGSSLLVANILEKGQIEKEIYLPMGSNWLDLNSFKLYKGGKKIRVPVDLGSIPMFLRSGGIIPESQHLSNITKQVIDKIDLIIYPEKTSEFSIYEDDGVTNEFKKGAYLLTSINVDNKDKREVKIKFKRTGKFKTNIKYFNIKMYCKEIAPLEVVLEKEKVERFLNIEDFNMAETGWFFDGQKKMALIKMVNQKNDCFNLNIVFGSKDLISI